MLFNIKWLLNLWAFLGDKTRGFSSPYHYTKWIVLKSCIKEDFFLPVLFFSMINKESANGIKLALMLMFRYIQCCGSRYIEFTVDPNPRLYQVWKKNVKTILEKNNSLKEIFHRKKFLVSWVAKWWIYVFNLVRIHLGSGSTTLVSIIKLSFQN